MSTRQPHTTHPHEVDLLLASELLGPGAGRVEALPDPPGPHVCRACERPFVVAGEIREVVGSDAVRLELACANCGWSATAVHDDRELAALEMHADRALADLLWTLELVWIANEEAAIARFAAALRADAILPEDFA